MPEDDRSREMSVKATTRTLLAGRDPDLGILSFWKGTCSDVNDLGIDALREIFKNRIGRSVCSFRLNHTVSEALRSSEAAPAARIKRIALAPGTVREGDEICMILGCTTPVVLRRVRNHYCVLGEAYIDTTTMGGFNVTGRPMDFLLE